MPPKTAYKTSVNKDIQGRLPLYGPARLEVGDSGVKLRRKSLAILYYLALEGVSRRQLLADLLWEQVDSSQNLRVELHYLRKTLTDLGLDSLTVSRDLLSLPDKLRLDRGKRSGELLEGLEDLTPSFQEWLEQRRAQEFTRGSESYVHRDLVREMVNRVRLPYLIILSGEPDSGQQQFATSLASALGLPISNDVSGGRAGVRYLAATRNFGDDALERILADGETLWILERDRFAEDPEFQLRLRSSFPPERVSYLELPMLGWQEMRTQLSSSVPFEAAAELFLRSGGHPGLLREMESLAPRDRSGQRDVLPQRIRAAYQLEARHLSPPARFALERASIHPGPLPHGLLEELEVTPHLVELERRNWLTFDGGWRFQSGVSRRIIYRSLLRGHARLYHQSAARRLELDGDELGAAYHRSEFSGKIEWHRVAANCEGWARCVAEERGGETSETLAVPRKVLVNLLDEQPLLESSYYGEGMEARLGRVSMFRQPLDAGRSGAEWHLPEGEGVLHLEGQMVADNSLDVGLDGDAVPLQLDFLGKQLRSVVFAPLVQPQVLADGTHLLPLTPRLDWHFRFEQGVVLRLSSRAEAAVAELSVAAHRLSKSDGKRVQAYDLT